MAPPRTHGVLGCGEPDWDFFLPDDDETYPEPGDFWLEPEDED